MRLFFFAKITYPFMREKSKEEITMMEFIILTCGITVGVLMASVIATVLLFTLMSNTKFMVWLTNYYLKVIEKSCENFEKKSGIEDL